MCDNLARLPLASVSSVGEKNPKHEQNPPREYIRSVRSAKCWAENGPFAFSKRAQRKKSRSLTTMYISAGRETRTNIVDSRLCSQHEKKRERFLKTPMTVSNPVHNHIMINLVPHQFSTTRVKPSPWHHHDENDRDHNVISDSVIVIASKLAENYKFCWCLRVTWQGSRTSL